MRQPRFDLIPPPPVSSQWPLSPHRAVLDSVPQPVSTQDSREEAPLRHPGSPTGVRARPASSTHDGPGGPGATCRARPHPPDTTGGARGAGRACGTRGDSQAAYSNVGDPHDRAWQGSQAVTTPKQLRKYGKLRFTYGGYYFSGLKEI